MGLDATAKCELQLQVAPAGKATDQQQLSRSHLPNSSRAHSRAGYRIRREKKNPEVTHHPFRRARTHSAGPAAGDGGADWAVPMWIPSSCVVLGFLIAKAFAESRPGTARRNQRPAAEIRWFQELRPEDLDPARWRRAEEQFFMFALRISRLFRLSNAELRFALVGACDGQYEATISRFFIPQSHWRAVFVEALYDNCQDLERFLRNHQVYQRSLVVHGALTDICENDSVEILRPIIDRSNETLPHWIRKEIGGIATKISPLIDEWHKLSDSMVRDSVKGWTKESVKCIVPIDILSRWSAYLRNDTSSVTPSHEIMRPHVLKIDAEGHDYEVLT